MVGLDKNTMGSDRREFRAPVPGLSRAKIIFVYENTSLLHPGGCEVKALKLVFPPVNPDSTVTIVCFLFIAGAGNPG